jgi:hypothetical protein
VRQHTHPSGYHGKEYPVDYRAKNRTDHESRKRSTSRFAHTEAMANCDYTTAGRLSRAGSLRVRSYVSCSLAAASAWDVGRLVRSMQARNAVPKCCEWRPRAYLGTATVPHQTGAPTCSRLMLSPGGNGDRGRPGRQSRLQVGAPVAVSRCAGTPQSDALSQDLLARGFKFVGPTIGYAFMQAVGMVNDHLVGCFRYRERE